jgi:threonine dehydratase
MKSSAKKSNERAKEPASTVTLKSIEQAAKRIRDSIYLSPFMRSETFSQLTGNSLFLKLENLQMTGSFKERGALNKILLLTPSSARITTKLARKPYAAAPNIPSPSSIPSMMTR